MDSISTKELSIAYGSYEVVSKLNLNIPKGKITSIIGANGSGKSTILKTIARIHKPSSGNIIINGKDINNYSSRVLAKSMAVLPQGPKAPQGLTVGELVAYGRFPHQSGYAKLMPEDRKAITWALEATNTAEFIDRPVEALSGGQRQRVWIAMALAQETELLMLDEPTTYLDLANQLEVLELLMNLNKVQGRTVVMVIHELNNASRVSDYMVGIRNGKIVCEGSPKEVMTKSNLKEVFNIDAEIITEPRGGKPVCITFDLL